MPNKNDPTGLASDESRAGDLKDFDVQKCENKLPSIKKSRTRTKRSSPQADAGHSRREVLLKTCIALLFTGGINLDTSPVDPGPGDMLANPTTSGEALKPGTPTAADFVSLGEHLSYLSNLPSCARVYDVANVSKRLMEILSEIDLPATREAARPLYRLRCHYGLSSMVLCEQSKRIIAEQLIPIRQTLDAEVGDFDAS